MLLLSNGMLFERLAVKQFAKQLIRHIVRQTN